ncbi:MAG TPA: MFS transporter [Chloroflexaceae bacterium]|nr:MFS transporter [Chloroflexaceae bacterium]
MSGPLARLRRRSPLAIVFGCVLVDMLGYGMVVPLLPFLVRERSESALLVGLLSSLYALVQLLVAPLLGAASDRAGRRPVLIGCLLGSAAAYGLLAASAALGSLPLTFAAVAMGGAAGASIPTAQAYIADSTAPEERARGLGLLGAAFGLGLMLGPASGGLLSVYGLAAPAALAAGLALLNALYALAALPESLTAGRRARQPMRPGAVAGQLAAALATPGMRRLLLAIFLLNLAFAGLQSNFPVFSSARFGWGPVANGAFFAFVGACAVLTQGALVGRLQPRLGEPALVIGGLAVMAAGLAATAVAPAGWALYPIVGLMALGTGLAIPSLTSLVSRRAGEGRQGAAMGGVQSLLSLALILGPALAGLLFDAAGPPAPYLAGAALAGAALLAAAAGLWPELRRGLSSRGGELPTPPQP